MKNLYILGAGGQAGKATVLAEILGYKLLGFISSEEKGTLKHGFSIVSNIQDLENLLSYEVNNVYIGIGEPYVRKQLWHQIENLQNINFPILAHPSSYVSKTAHLNSGTFVGVHAIIEHQAEIGHHCLIDSAAIIEHNCKIGDFVNVSPGASLAGNVNIGDATIIGINASIKENIIIGSNVVVGAGAVVINDIPDNAVVYGVPARIKRFRLSDDKTFR
jgi:sugar O-acyltransferase (sialic acid O-acetyltransferase NeuD family)